MNLEPTRAQLKVFSAVFSNLAAAWVIAIFLTPSLSALTLNIVAIIISVVLAIRAEELSEEA